MPQGEQNTSIPIPVLVGMRDDLEPHTAPTGTITLARNVRFPTNGVVQSRRGQAALSSASAADVAYSDALNTAQGPDFLHPCAGGFVFGAAGYSYRYDADAGYCYAAGSYSTAQPRGVFETMAREELAPSQAGRLLPWPLSTARAYGAVAICYAVGNGQPVGGGGRVVGTQYDAINPVATAGAVIRVLTEDGTPISSGYWDDMWSAMVIADGGGTSMWIVYQNGTDISVRNIDSNGVVGAATSVGTLSTTTSYYAACPWPGVGWALVYQSAAGDITVKKMVATASVASTTIAISAGAGAPVSCYADTTNLYVGWAKRGGVSYDAEAMVFSTALAITSGGIVTVYAFGAATVALGPPLFGASVTAGTVLVLVGDLLIKTHPAYLTSAGVLTAGTAQLATIPLSAPFANGLWWAKTITTYASGVQQSQRAVLLDFQESRSSASTAATRLKYPKVALLCDSFTTPASFSGVTDSVPNDYAQHLHTPIQLTSGEWVMGIPKLVRKELDSAPAVMAYLMLCEWLKFATGCEQQARTVRDDVIVTGSPAVVSYSGGSYQYANGGFTLVPQSFGLDLGLIQMPGIRAGSGVTVGSLVAGSTYQYRAELELIDSRGKRWRSPPSVVASVTIGGGQSSADIDIDAWVPLLRNFNPFPSNSRMVAHVYRSIAAASNFQRCTPAQGAPVIYTTGTVRYVDTLSDTLLAEREFIYTDGGATAHDHAPSCRFIAVTEDRVWLAGLWDTTIAQSSKITVPGEPVQFSDLPAFQTVIPEPITGIASLDGTVVFFAVSSIYKLQGLGPNDQGQGAWDTPRAVTHSTGCIDWRSIVETSIGIFYQSERGIMLLPRGLGEPQFIGMPVQATLESFGAVITGSDVCTTSDGNTVRFCTASGTLIYDLETQAWSHDIPPIAPEGMVHTKICDTDAGPTYARKVLTSEFGFDQERTALTTDNGNAIPSFVQWAPVHPAPLAGWCTFTGAISVFGKLDGAAYPASALAVTCNVDNATNNTVTKATMADMADIDYRGFNTAQNRQGCSATLSFATVAAPWRFIGWTLELEPQQGTRNVPQIQKY